MSRAADTSTPSRLLRALALGMAGPPPVPAGAHLLVAASGGPDSTALLHGLAALAPDAGWRLTAAHVDHGLRGAASVADRDAVERMAARLGLDCAVRVVEVPPGPALEARARQARLRALAGLASERRASHIVLGHTADDQAETMLLRLARGAGRGGLAGMRARRGRFIRPLLGATRADVRRFLADRGVEAALDRSNADLRHTRNRLRRLVLPLVAAELNPALVPALAALATRLRDEDDYLARMAAVRQEALLRSDGLDVAVAAEPPALARRIVRTWLERHRRRSVHAIHVERVLELVRRRETGTVALPGSLVVRRDGDRLLRGSGASAAAFHLAIVPGTVVAHPGGGWRLALDLPETAPAGASPRVGGFAEAVFDADALPAELAVRSRRPGDRIHIPGLGTRKVQDVLVDAKVPRAARDAVPLLEADGAIIWVAGVARGSGARVGPATRRIVRGRLERGGGAP